MRFIFPNYKNNIINISSTFGEMLGNKSCVPTLEVLKKYLSKDYKNVVFIILDGFGINPIEINLSKDNFLRKNIKCKLTSVFPSTTTNATTTLMSGDYPFNHGWFGWSIYFEELNRAVEVYRKKDYYTQEDVSGEFITSRLPFKPYYKNSKNYEVNKVLPVYVKDGIQDNNYTYENLEEMFEKIKLCCKKNGKQFIYSYSGEPDSTMHEYGVSSKEANNIITKLSGLVENLKSDVDDTLIVVTADHGQVDISEDVKLFENKELLECLKAPPYLEPRATAFKVKEEKNKDFERLFNKSYGKDFKLFKSSYLIKKGVFGPCNERNKELLGDYISVCKNNKQFLFVDGEGFKGHHTSLTKEMLVPLIIIE